MITIDRVAKKYIASVVMMLLFTMSASAQSGLVDMLVAGEPVSERQHNVQGIRSEIKQDALQEPSRILLAPETASWEGGKLSFTMKVDPEKENYFTARFWGSEANPNTLVLFCEGKQIGYHHLGDYDILYLGDEAPAYNDRFFYNTTPLPLALTKGRTELHFEIRSRGPAWRYGQSFEQYQKNMIKPSCGIYRLYTHTQSCFVPPPQEKQGIVPDGNTIRKSPGSEVLLKVKERVNQALEALMHTAQPLSQQEMFFMAKAWHVRWTVAYRAATIPSQIAKSIDAFYWNQKRNPKHVTYDPQQYNPDWFGFGTIGNAILLLENEFTPFLKETVTDSTGYTVNRKQAWAELMLASREYLRTHRRQYTNQSMIIDMNIYLSNKALAMLAPEKAFSEREALRYIYEAVGLQPWLGSDTDHGPEKPLGENYFQLTDKGLTKELGYVGYYGEVLDWVTQIYTATCRPLDPSSGDKRIREQLVKMANARVVFRYPTVDAEGYKAMRIETITGWRDTHYPGDVTYTERQGWDASPFLSVVTTLDNQSVGYAQQMLEENQFFKTVEDKMATSTNLRVTQSLLPIPDQYETIKSQPPRKYRLPMYASEPDGIWSDEEDGVVAVKQGEDILYVSLYWRARHAVNYLARIHYITPVYDRVAVVRQHCEFIPSGLQYTRPDHIDFGFGNGGHQYPGDLHSAHAGEKLPIAKIPAGIAYNAGDENSYAGKADFYVLVYGPYLIAMNTTRDRTYTLSIPGNFSNARDLSSGKTIGSIRSIPVSSRKTIVLYKKTTAGNP
jgi:hypothetical protein